jgi:pantetheine-phosphate adenylyltransferase
VKGLRAISDFEYEFEMNQLNRMQATDVDTLYLMAGPQYSFLSSSGVKEIATFGGDIDALVPATVARRLHEELNRSRS